MMAAVPADLPGPDFDRLKGFIRTETGIDLPESNVRTVRHFLLERLAALGVDLAGYLRRIGSDPAEYDRFIDAVTINETYFFREERHFGVLASRFFPEMPDGDPIRFWSAACATGEEAVSLAAMAADFLKGVGRRFSVLATDINRRSLEIFREGVYSANAFRRDGARFHHLLDPHLEGDGPRRRLDASLRAAIQIRHLNLFRDNLTDLADGFHAAMLRNTLIYMDLETRRAILDKVVTALKTDGLLFLGAAEMPLIAHPHLKLESVDGVYFFRKKRLEEKMAGMEIDVDAAGAGKRRRVERAVRDRMPGTRKAPYAIDPETIMIYACQRLDNRLFEVENDPHFSFALQFLQIVHFMNGNGMAEARDLLDIIDAVLPENAISHYLYGYLEMAAGRSDAARYRFGKALAFDPAFWPARFHLAMLTRTRFPRQAAAEYRRCEADIRAYIEAGSYRFRFLLEGFNARYFMDMCRKWIDKLGDGERSPKGV
jgi:chemotaxis protein methyltransferase CheR